MQAKQRLQAPRSSTQRQWPTGRWAALAEPFCLSSISAPLPIHRYGMNQSIKRCSLGLLQAQIVNMIPGFVLGGICAFGFLLMTIWVNKCCTKCMIALDSDFLCSATVMAVALLGKGTWPRPWPDGLGVRLSQVCVRCCRRRKLASGSEPISDQFLTDGGLSLAPPFSVSRLKHGESGR